jgi:2,3-dihydroxybiphenyl 1,2-dioxygenase
MEDSNMDDRRLDDPSDVRVSQFGYLGIGVSDMGAWKEFSGSLLGLQENGASASGDVFLRLDEYHHRFVLVENGRDDIAFHGWEVKDAAALEQIAAKIRSYGITVTQGTAEEAAERMVVGLVKFTDPDGIPAEVYYGPLIDHRPFVSPRGVKGFKADALGFGHMVIAVEDADAYVRFFTDVMGARLSDYIVVSRGAMTLQLVFLHVNPRHHSLAVVQRMKNPDGMPSPRRLNHVMVEPHSIDDVGIALGLFQQKGIPTGALGRHSNDRMLSFYGETPSGFNVEYGCDGVLIEDEANWEVRQHRATSIWGHGIVQPPRPPAG